MTAIKKIFKVISSMKMAIIIIILITVFASLSTFVLQGEELPFYIDKYKIIGYFFYYSGISNFFKSVLFIILLTLFFINLLLCTIKRLFKEFTGKIKISIGPDIIHLGILTLIISGLIGISAIKEGYLLLSIGESFKIGKKELTFTSFDFQQYSDNSPKDWISTIVIEDIESQVHLETVKVEVNKPYRIDGYLIYQNSFSEEKYISLKSKESEKVYHINLNERFEIDNTVYQLLNIHDAKIAEITDTKNLTTKSYNVGDDLDGFIIKSIYDSNRTGLFIKKDPTYSLKLISLFVIFFGLILTYLQKIKEKK